MAAFDEAFRKTIVLEGSVFVPDPDDSGGPTFFGVTQRVARSCGYDGPMNEIPFDTVRWIYQKQWWELLNLDRVADLSAAVAEEVFDTAVHCGQHTAAKFLQKALNVLNREEKDFPDIRVDGLIGILTISSLRLYLQKRDPIVLLKVLNCLQGARYVEIATVRRKDEKYTYGWFKQRVRL